MRLNGAHQVLCNEVGGIADMVRAGTAAMVGSTIDDYVEHPTVRGGDDHKWVVNGNASYSTSDGIHPSSIGASLMCLDLVTSLNILIAQQG